MNNTDVFKELVAQIATRAPKSLLADCAYQGPPSQRMIRNNDHYQAGYNQALDDTRELIAVTLAAHGIPCQKSAAGYPIFLDESIP